MEDRLIKILFLCTDLKSLFPSMWTDVYGSFLENNNSNITWSLSLGFPRFVQVTYQFFHITLNNFIVELQSNEKKAK